ncbi:PepSY-associated TM helix domain-containing protein [Streptomyces sp. RPT161]|uniref:PepSY-associated TM helix domain-containing protein n=1 Tax=Streptomyces sp. RPT161 TaxID=3015993 RepID=UPI0022B884A7|nr:PepSY-associated TM helix domain-containing protein [Streptomyces sp. RPT161]
MALGDTTLETARREDEAATSAAAPRPEGRVPGGTVARPPGLWAATRPLLMRLHFYVGVLIGPFLLVAATTGLLYTTSPQLEQFVYRHELHVTAQSASHAVPLAAQVAAGRAAVPDGTLQSVSPAAGPTDTTRVLFDAKGVPQGWSRTAFVDPYTGKVLGVLTTDGQWLPLRAWLDTLHRTLHLGAFGRNYSELAASWLWVEVLGGLALWLGVRRRRDRIRRTLLPRLRGPGHRRVLSWHAVVGLWVSLGLLGLSATGLTWSDHAGANVGQIRAQLKGGTPSVPTALPAHQATAHTRGSDVGIDAVVRSAHRAGLSGVLVVTPPAAPGRAWVVKENTRHWPERQDSVAVDPATGKVTAKLRFADYPLLAKLTRWGIDAHMGLLFGLPNQIALALLAATLIAMVLWGYRMWWLRRPTRSTCAAFGRAPARGAWRRLPGRVLAPAVLAVAVLGYYLPLLGIPLLVFLATDLAVGAVVRRRAAAAGVAR